MFGLFYQNFNGCSWLLEIYILNVVVKGVGVLDEDGLTIRGWGRGETVSNVLKGDRMGKKGGETKLL